MCVVHLYIHTEHEQSQEDLEREITKVTGVNQLLLILCLFLLLRPKWFVWCTT